LSKLTGGNLYSLEFDSCLVFFLVLCGLIFFCLKSVKSEMLSSFFTVFEIVDLITSVLLAVGFSYNSSNSKLLA